MKNIFITFIAFIVCIYTSKAQINQKQTFSVSVNLSQLKTIPSPIYLIYFKKTAAGLTMITDSAIVKNGTARFDGFTEEPLAATIRTKMFNTGERFCLSPGNININIGPTWAQYSVAGSIYQDDFEKLCTMQIDYQKRLNLIGDQIKLSAKAKDTVTLTRYRTEFTKVSGRMYDSVFKAYIITHAKTSALSVYALNIYASVKKGLPADSLYNMLSPTFKNLPTAVFLRKEIDQTISVMIGRSAPLFSQKDTAGKIVNLINFRRKYVLINFWASWCKPCRAENPDLIKIYKKYHQKNFEILGVSLDNSSSQKGWLKAIKDDQIGLWTQVSDLKGFESTAAKQYNIHAIPQNYLLNPNGEIVAKNLSLDELAKKLDQLL